MTIPGSAGQFERAEPSPQATITVLADQLGQILARLITIEAKLDAAIARMDRAR